MKIIVIYHDGCPTSILSVDPPSSMKKCLTCEAKIDFNDPKWSIKPLPSSISATQKETAGCIVVKPSHGNIQSYSVGKDLHIGISDSNGQVYSFWTKGVEAQKTTNYKAVDFAEEFTAKKMQGVVKYIALYNKLLKEN